MNRVRVETHDVEASALRACLRDLVALSDIPAVWVERAATVREPGTEAVASALADALVSLLQLDFAFVRLREPRGRGAVDVARGTAWSRFPEWLERHLAAGGRFLRREVVPDVGDGSGRCRGVVIPIGLDGEAGVVAAAAARSAFPTPTDHLLLSLAANQAATAFQTARVIHERTSAERQLREARNELEVKVAERTAELRRSEAYLAEAQRLTHTGSFAIDAATREVTHSSHEHSRLYGFHPAKGTPTLAEFLERIHPDDVQTCIEALERGIHDGTKIELEYRAVFPPGSVKHHRAVAHPVFDERGKLREFVGTIVDVTERRHAEEERRAQLWLLESLDRINRAIQRTSDIEQMLGAVLDAVMAIFDCDRAWLIYPCDPDVSFLRVLIERTRPEHLGAFALNVEVPNDPESAAVIRALLASSGPVRCDPESGRAVPSAAAERFGIKSMIAAAVYPKTDKPYMFGLHQCSRARIWTAAEERLFQEIGRRLADALDTMLMFVDLRESERNIERSRAEVAASRARIIAAADETRRQIERDLHDSVQQRLVSLALMLRQAQGEVPDDLPDLQTSLARTADGLTDLLTEVQEISRGIHPSVLSKGGLALALKSLARRSAIPVEVSVQAQGRLPEDVEVAAYYVIAEAVANVIKHARATGAAVYLGADAERLQIEVRDDGIGGADPDHGSGLVGLTDRVEALGGTIDVASAPGTGTTLHATLPLKPAWRAPR
ncbi:MAG TPA: PAS domain-containing protein [Thermoleophilaceae bacterium]|nr:PAS domain-containing protein [Thermoleophilaceae bacterium]